jgi:hypothetical protein
MPLPSAPIAAVTAVAAPAGMRARPLRLILGDGRRILLANGWDGDA